jgi:hypothetical protein
MPSGPPRSFSSFQRTHVAVPGTSVSRTEPMPPHDFSKGNHVRGSAG